MNSTPQLRSAFPTTPQTGLKRRSPNDAKDASITSPPPFRLPAVTKAGPNRDSNAPTIPFTLVDAPSQRLYVSLIYVGLLAWRLFDYFNLPLDGSEGFWLFTKWVGIDTAFLYGLSGLNIPWLQWSSSTFTALFIVHAMLDWLLMFQIPIPLFSWLGYFVKIFYDREYAVSERYVKPASILQNSSVILGKQIIHILPEGSVHLNPARTAFCIGDSNSAVDLPILINQTTPIFMELTRIELGNNAQDPITVSAKEMKKIMKTSVKHHTNRGSSEPLLLHYTVRTTGLYRLQTVIDESKLEVRQRRSYALVVDCPIASIPQVPKDRCLGDLSDFALHVEATPPLRVKYRKTINRDDRGHTVLTIQPNGFNSPLLSKSHSELSFPRDPADIDLSWAQSRPIRIPLNESLDVDGGWQYTIEEIDDACGNKINYTDSRQSSSRSYALAKSNDLEQHFIVHKRPKFAIQNCNAQSPLKVQTGQTAVLSLSAESVAGSTGGESYSLSYLFIPEEQIIAGQQQRAPGGSVHEITFPSDHQGNFDIQIKEPGLYSLQSVQSTFCKGEIMEPSSCQLTNPMEPDMSISAEQIPDKCAGKSIGLLVDLELTGTPPFRVFYTVKHQGGSVQPKAEYIDRFHTQLELRPVQAGHYVYQFDHISDAVYNYVSLKSKNLVLEQDVRPPASATFSDLGSARRKVCLEQPLTFRISFVGEPPFNLEYEIVHRGRRMKEIARDIPGASYELQTAPFTQGGEYTVALTSVTDATGCRQALEAEAKFEVGLQRPRAAFAQVQGKRSKLAVENRGVRLPVKLQGEPPFIISYRNVEQRDSQSVWKRLSHNNAEIDVDDQGTFELLSVEDANCPGAIDDSAKQFSLTWVKRPSLTVSHSPLIDNVGGQLEKRAICQGDEDATEIKFSGNAPYEFQYDRRFKSDRGSQSTMTKKLTSGFDTASVKMETAEPGVYTYRITKLGDASYGHDSRAFSPVNFQQRVFPQPEAFFAESGKTYRYCKDANEGAEHIPITLNGAPPFQLELEIKHHANAKPERINLPNVDTTRYNLRVPSRVLALGSHSVSIRKVQDSRGCQRVTDLSASQVQVSVSDVPGISPLEEDNDFCVGDRITFALLGTPPFNVFYTFQGRERKAKVSSTDFRRIAEQPGQFLITGVSDARSTDSCKGKVDILKTIHELPSVRVSKGRTAITDIHEGGEADILFEFGGTPPFHFTYTRSTTPSKGKKGVVLETKHGVSHEHSLTVRASDEGLYQVVSIRDKYCAFSAEQVVAKSKDRYF